jgi:hypothetical protein
VTAARWAIGVAVVIGALGANSSDGVRAGPGHEDGKVELYVSDFHVHAEGDAQRAHAVLVDRDSGTPAPGFDVTLSATGQGRTVGPVVLAGDAEGNYTALVELDPGAWTVTIDAEQGGSATPANATTQTFTVEVVAGGDSEDGGSSTRTLFVAAGAVAVVLAAAFGLRRRLRAAA